MVRLVKWSMVSMGQQATASRAHWQAREATPGSESASSLTTRVRGNQGDPIVGAGRKAHLLTSLNSEEEGGDDRKSEAPIGARISGNAEGAKGRRFEIADEGNMTRHRADCAHDN
jgi:hypothetical protein